MKKPLNETSWNRREFLEFMGMGAVTLSSLPVLTSLTGCFQSSEASPFKFGVVQPQTTDDVVLGQGLEYTILRRWDDPINAKEKFGFNNDYTAFFPLQQNSSEDGLLWVNHEYVNSQFFGEDSENKTKEQVDREMASVGGSIIRIKKDKGKWKTVVGDPLNRRIDGSTPIPFSGGNRIAGSKQALGTCANCAGGVTPWKTVLTCEENYHGFWGEIHVDGTPTGKHPPYTSYWYNFYKRPSAHYGWVTEINPTTGEAKKHISMGRVGRECATVIEAKDKRPVVYSGHDRNNECIYKFIGDQPGSLEKGKLYVADTNGGRWIEVNHQKHEVLKEKFKDQLHVLTHTPHAAKLIGGTPQNRPEDVEINPHDGSILIALTNNKKKGDYFGSILKIKEKNGDYLSMEFEAQTFLMGGDKSGFACPDNLAFDPQGNLWMTSDISGRAMNKGKYAPFKNNGLFCIPMKGPGAGKIFQVASAPTDAEFTGPTFTPDGKTLFLSVQHPGENSKNPKDPSTLTSHWPEGGQSVPRSAVVAITGF